MYEDEDDELLLNPIFLINQYELENQNKQLKNNLDVNTYKEQNSAEFPCNINNNSRVKGNASLNSTVNTNVAVENSLNENNINYNISFFSFGDKNKKEEKKELTQKSIEILGGFISKEEKLKEMDKIKEKNNQLKKRKFEDIKCEIQINLQKIERNLSNYFRRPFMRKNYEDNKIFKTIIDEENKEDKKINISDEINKQNITNEVNVNKWKEM